MIGVAGRDDFEVFQAWVTDQQVDGFEHIADVDGSVWAEFGIRSQPAFTFINDDGTVENHQGRLGAEELNDRLAALVTR